MLRCSYWGGDTALKHVFRLDVHTRGGTPHMKICSDVYLRVGTPHIKCVEMFIQGWGHLKRKMFTYSNWGWDTAHKDKTR